MVKKGEENKIETVYSYDVNSMYPYQLVDKEMPYGSPRHFEGKYEKPKRKEVYVQHIKMFFLYKEKTPTVYSIKNIQQYSKIIFGLKIVIILLIYI